MIPKTYKEVIDLGDGREISIETGKLADLVALSDDLTKIEPSKIKDITVLETIKEGKTVFKK